ncbi:MAG: hypothetical protein H6953_17025, partial [Chromatiaceae bacterium]|nr:hypothetical protein [Chromatiaceae bacterium]
MLFLEAYPGRLTGVALLVLVVLSVWLLWISYDLRRRWRHERGDQRAILRELGDDIGDDVANNRQQLQESLSAGLMRLQDLIDQRLGGLQRQLLQDSAGLKTDLIERFEAQRQATGESLAGARLAQQREAADLREALEAALNRHREVAERHQREALAGQQEALTGGMAAMASQVSEAFRTAS